MLPFSLTLEGKRDSLLDQFHDFLVGVGHGRPALDVGGLGPPTAFFVVVDNAYWFHLSSL